RARARPAALARVREPEGRVGHEPRPDRRSLERPRPAARDRGRYRRQHRHGILVVMGARAATLVAGLTAAVAIAGCSGRTFRPVLPRAAVDPEVGVNVDNIYVTHFPGELLDATYGIRVNLEVSWRAPTRIGEA